MSSWVVVGYLYMYVDQERHAHNCMLKGEGEVIDLGRQGPWRAGNRGDPEHRWKDEP